jgi:hypothetical protein
MPVPKKAQDLIRRLAVRRDEISDDLIDGVEGIERRALRAIMRKIGEMSQSKGGLRLSGANARKLNRLKKEIEEIIKNPAYMSAGRRYLRSFKEIDELNVQKYQAMDLPATGKMFEDIRNFTLGTFEQQLLGSGLEASVINPLFAKINNLVMSGADYGHIEDELTQFLSGTQGIAAHVRTIAVDTINQYNGTVNERVGTEFGLEWGVYVGSIIGTSAGQCAKWVKMRYIHRSELEKEIAWVRNNSGKKTNRAGEIVTNGKYRIGGMIPGTTPSSFAINRGHYGCRHEFIYVSTSSVPEEAQERVK